jgi:feruloyl-CoA synthase
MGDAVSLFDPQDPSKGFAFEGRLSEDFAVDGNPGQAGPLRQRFLAHFGDIVQDVVIAGHERDEVTALAFPAIGACRALCGPNSEVLSVRELFERDVVRAVFCERLTSFAQVNTGHSTRVARLILLEDPPSIDAQETTDKGSVNQKSVLTNRSALVAQLYGAGGPGIVISRATSAPAGAERGAGVPASDGAGGFGGAKPRLIYDHRYGKARRH